MTSRKKPSCRPATVTLTRRDVETILVRTMGWEPIDVTSFWRVARQITGSNHDVIVEGRGEP